MDRQTTYSGQVPRTVDLLQAQQNIMVALAKLSAGVLGTATIVNGFNCTPTNPATLDVILTAGEIYSLEDLEATTWSALPADTTDVILKQGILLEPATMAVTPPSTFGYSQVYLLEVAYKDNDTGSLGLPYFNAANPQSPLAGPGNAGTAQNTIRQGAVAYQLKAGLAAPTGTQVAPEPDPGWTPLFEITVAQGQTTVTAGNIVNVLGQVPALPTTQPPYIPVTLPQVPVAVQSGMWLYGQDSSSVMNVITVGDLNPPIGSTLTPGMTLRIKIGAWAKVNTFTATTTDNSGELTSVSSTAGLVVGQVINGAGVPAGSTIGTISGSTITLANDAEATASASNVTFTCGGNTSAVAMDVGTGAEAVVRSTGAQLSANDIAEQGQILEVCWDGSHWQVLNFYGQPGVSGGGGGGGTTTINNYYTSFGIPYCADTSDTPDTIVAPFNPAITAPTSGQMVVVKLANTVTGPTVIQVNALSAVPVVNQFLQPLQANDAVVDEMLLLVYTGSAWQLTGAGALVRQFGGVAATYKNLIGSAPGGTKTASWHVDEVVAETALGGFPFKGANLALSFNGGTTGPGGMDTGATPVSGDLSVYVVYNPTTQTWNTLGCAGGTSNGTIYSGSNMPSGYTASALIWSGKTDSSGNVIGFGQFNSRVSPIGWADTGTPANPPTGGLTNDFPFYLTLGIETYNPVSLSSLVPANAKTVSGWFTATWGGSGASDGAPPAYYLASNTSGVGAIFYQLSNMGGAAGQWVGSFQFNDVVLMTAQTLYMGPPSNIVQGGVVDYML